MIPESHLKLNRRGVPSQPGRRAERRLVTLARCCPVCPGTKTDPGNEQGSDAPGVSVRLDCAFLIRLTVCRWTCVFVSGSIKRHVYMAKWLWRGACCLQVSERVGSQQNIFDSYRMWAEASFYVIFPKNRHLNWVCIPDPVFVKACLCACACASLCRPTRTWVRVVSPVLELPSQTWSAATNPVCEWIGHCNPFHNK